MVAAETSPGRSRRSRESFYGRLSAVDRPYRLSPYLQAFDSALDVPPGSYLKDMQVRDSFGKAIGLAVQIHARRTGIPESDVFGRLVLDHCPDLFPDTIVSETQKRGHRSSDLVTILPYHFWIAAQAMSREQPSAAADFLYGALGMTPESARGTFQQLWRRDDPNYQIDTLQEEMLLSVERVYRLPVGTISRVRFDYLDDDDF